jgi:ACS family hexuronate transporter-like MFS transporter
MGKIRNLRWWIIGMIFFASVLNYIDRQALSILAPTVQKELGLTNQDYAHVVNLFLVAYTISYIVSGRLVDKLGVRLSLALFIGWWSVANMLTAFSRSLGSLGAFRFLLGLGEAGNWTAAPKAVSEWFPARERGLAIGIYTLGATIGATLAPVLILALATWHSWQAAFVVTGAAGLLWLIPWFWLYRRPAEHPRITAEELAHIASDSSAEKTADTADWGGWRALFVRRELWLLVLGRMLTDPVWYFFQFWFAKYLYEGRGLDQKSLSVTWVVFLAADMGALSGGWFSGRLIKRKIAPAMSRLRVMLACAALVPLAALIPLSGSLWLVLALGMVAILAHMAWLINLSALVTDLVPRRSLATVFGLVAAGSTLGGIMMNQAVGQLVSGHSYDLAFYLMVGVHPLAWTILWFGRVLRPSAITAP